MKKKEIKIDLWKRLYQAADRFKQQNCKEWMNETDLFGVQNPRTNEIGYCSVLGKSGGLFALCVHKGSRGLENAKLFQEGKLTATPDNIIQYHQCLMISFDKKEHLKDSDLKILKKLDFELNDDEEYPMFRDFTPGYFPWAIDIDDAKYLAMLFEHVIEIAENMKEKPELYRSSNEKELFVRLTEMKKGNLTMRDCFQVPEPAASVLPPFRVNKTQLDQIKENSMMQGSTWEIDFAFASFSVQEGSRPYFPNIYIAVDKDVKQVLDYHIAGEDDYLDEFEEKFLAYIQAQSIYPMKIQVIRSEMYEYFKPFTDYFEIQLEKVNHLPLLEQAKKQVFQHMQSQVNQQSNQ